MHGNNDKYQMFSLCCIKYPNFRSVNHPSQFQISPSSPSQFQNQSSIYPNFTNSSIPISTPISSIPISKWPISSIPNYPFQTPNCEPGLKCLNDIGNPVLKAAVAVTVLRCLTITHAHALYIHASRSVSG